MSGWRLSERQARLLEIALSSPEDAAAAWPRFLAGVDVDSLDGASHELLGLLYRKLSAAGGPQPELGRLKGVYRRDWYANQVLRRRARTALEVLAAAGVPALVLGGAALVPLLHDEEVAARPMSDTAIAVRPPAVAAALQALRSAGWDGPPGRPEALVATRLGAPLSDGAGGTLALRWYPVPLPSADGDLWEAAVAVDVDGAPARTPCAGDQLLLALAGGRQWEPGPRSFLWAADALAILRAPEARVDWDRLVRQAGEKRVAPAVAATLGHLRDALRAPVPAEALDQLRALPAERSERLALRAAAHAPTPLGVARVHRARREALARLEPGRRVGFADYVQQLAGREHRSQVPLHAAWRSLAIGARALRPR